MDGKKDMKTFVLPDINQDSSNFSTVSRQKGKHHSSNKVYMATESHRKSVHEEGFSSLFKSSKS